MNARAMESWGWRTVAEGLLAGFAGALIFAVIHFVYDVASGMPLRTPALLDAVFLEGAQSAREVEPQLSTLLRFSVLHVGGWGIAGVVSALAVCFVERRPNAWLAVFGGIAVVYISFLYVFGALSVPGYGALHLWLGILVGAATLATVLAVRHPDLAGHIERQAISKGEREGVELALGAEQSCLSLQRLLLDLCPGDEPLAALARHGERRVEALAEICERYALTGPTQESVTEGGEPGSLEAACHAARAAESDLIELYDRLLIVVVEPRIRDTFLRHRWESRDEHLQVYDACLERRKA